MESVRRTFTIEHCLGRGGFGEVYRAEMVSSTGLTTAVALKVLRRDVAPGGQAMQRLKDEGLMLARLNHPTILRVHDLVILEGRVSLVTEFVDGEDLERCLRGADRIGPRALIELVGQVASALDAAYNAPIGEHGSPLKLVHRDIKPSNLRISRHGEVKLLDFGIARSDEIAREARTMTDMMVGSPPYMAPERFLDAELRSASDVFGLGAIVLEGLIGRRVFDQPVTVLAALAVDRPRFETFIASRFADIPEDAPPEVVALAREMLTYEPEERPSAAVLARRCEALVDVVEGPSLTRWCRERRWRDPPRQAGDLDGRVVSEGTLARQTTPVSRETAFAEPTAVIPTDPTSERTTSTRTRGIAMWVGGASVVSTGVFLTAGVAAAIAVVIWAAWPSPETLGPIVAPTPPLTRPAPPEQPVTPPPVPVVAPVSPPVEQPRTPPPQPREKGKAPAPPQVEKPDPPPVPKAVPTPSAAVRITATGDASAVFVIVNGERIALPAQIPPGTWELRAIFDNDDVPQPPLTVREGANTTVHCSARFQKCSPL